MNENIVKIFIEDRFDFDKKLAELDEKISRLEKAVTIEREYVDKNITNAFKKIKFRFQKSKIINNFTYKFDVAIANNEKRIKKIEKMGNKPKSVEQGIEMFKKVFGCYNSINYGLGVVGERIEEIKNLLDYTNNVDEVVSFIENLTDILKSNYQQIKTLKSQMDTIIDTHGKYMSLCITELKKSHEEIY